MPDVRYTITVRNESQEQEARRTVAPNASAPTDQISQYVKSKLAPVALYHSAVSVITAISSPIHNTIEARTGNARAQERAQFAYSAAMKAVSVAASVALTAATGNPLPVIGMIAGGFSDVKGLLENGYAVGVQQNIENVERSMLLTRIGAGANRINNGGGWYQ